MSKPRGNHKNAAPTPPARKWRALAAAFVVLAVTGVAALGLWWWNARPDTEPPAAPQFAETGATSPSVTAAAAKADYQKLKGSWLRPDGGYVIDVKSVDDGGKMDASYSNPQPIHVAKAEASQDAGTLKVFIVLQDVNYPGSTYDLVYDPQSDSLKGIYYQAALQQRFEVIFTRMN